MEDLAHILIPLIGCSMIFGIVYVVISADNRQKMAMIDAGMNPKEKNLNKHSKLRFAMLAFFVPVGILVGQATHHIFDMEPETASVTFAFLFGGVGLLGTYFLENYLEDKFTKK